MTVSQNKPAELKREEGGAKFADAWNLPEKSHLSSLQPLNSFALMHLKDGSEQNHGEAPARLQKVPSSYFEHESQWRIISYEMAGNVAEEGQWRAERESAEKYSGSCQIAQAREKRERRKQNEQTVMVFNEDNSLNIPQSIT